jgi:hypothetical protein
MLNQHPDVDCGCEMGTYARDHKKHKLVPLEKCGSKRFMESIYDILNGRVKGFKVAYGPTWPQAAEWPEMWTYLSDNNVKVIDLYRENTFLRFVSLKLAIKDGFEEVNYTSQVEVFMDAYLAECESVRQARSRIVSNLSSPVFSVSYESLPESIVAVQEFLELPIKDLEASTLKQMDKDWKAYVKNAESLVKSATDLQWILKTPDTP